MNPCIAFPIIMLGLLAGCASRPSPLKGDALVHPEKAKARVPLIGAWRLVSWESSTDAQTNFPFGKDARGLLLYTATGQMSVFLSQPTRAVFSRAAAMAATVEEKAAAFDSCFAYAGTFEVAEGQVIHRLEQCTFPNWIGTQQIRFFRLEGDRLLLETPPLPTGDGQAVSRLLWERIHP